MKLIIKRDLKDYEYWKKLVSERNEMRADMGSRGITVYRDAKNPTRVYLVIDWDDEKPYQDYFNHPDVKKALADTGTTEIIEIGESFHLDA